MLKAENINVYYGNIQAIKGVSLEIHEGEIVTLIGANGAGKSTLLKTISGLLKPKQGKIVYEGNSIGGKAAQTIVKQGISHVPEGRRVFANMTVEENLQLGAYLRKDKSGIREDMDKIYELFPRLLERLKQQAGTLSGGEQQMLAMGRALMAKPKLLLLDEPSMGLAPLLVKTIFRIIEEINAAGTTILLVEQNANLALSIADRAYVMETGRIVLSGNAEELTSSEQIKMAYLGGH
ncbi:ABC transporter ATP-binding protein [Peribacillus sp. B-H-3]|uniref:ABC transporter ATP-binding protein n=1 Tax=Bacillaceae TaxID=186817 RepID=UPI0008E51A69|nr:MULTISPECIES: ABC transporter ATP-binding protein [unclassified Bacillus (in: firmicutes)]OIK09867.1 ABC transporter ATP-binding protein [Bacillus sp. MUM 13]SFC53197.1 amino acid/amide ABC transporter ATP-binding protein 2, HAAT family [Bacillus sp. OV322]